MKVKGMSRPGGCKSTSLPTPINISIPLTCREIFFPGVCLRVQVFKSYPLCTIVQCSVPGTRVGMPGFGPEGGERAALVSQTSHCSIYGLKGVRLYFYSFICNCRISTELYVITCPTASPGDSLESSQFLAVMLKSSVWDATLLPLPKAGTPTPSGFLVTTTPRNVHIHVFGLLPFVSFVYVLSPPHTL